MSSSIKNNLKSVFLSVPQILWGLVILCLLFSFLSEDFLSLANIMNILRQGSFLVIICMGVIIVQVMGGIELSVGGVMSLAGMVMAYALVNLQYSIPAGILLALLVGAFCGFLNGFFTDKMKVPSFIATLGMQYIAISLALVLNKGDVISGMPKATAVIGNSSILGIPFAVIVMVIAVLISHFILRYTVFGVYLYAIGGNEEALKLSGKKSWVYKLLGYAYCGIFAALAGVVVTIRMQCAQPTIGLGMEFEAFSGCVLGGAIVAGRGSVFGSLLGCLFIIILRNGLNNIGISTFYQLSIIGMSIIASIVITVFLSRKINGYA